MLWVNSKYFSKTVFFFLKIWWASAYFDRSNFFFLIERASICFDRSKLFFDRSNLFQIVFIESVSVLIDRGCFSIDRNSWILFFKKAKLDFLKSLFQKVYQLFSLSDLAKGSTINFFSFSSKIFARFLSLKADKSLLPFLLHFISCFHALLWVFSALSIYWGFWCFEPVFVKLINGFLFYDAIIMILVV